MISDPILTKVCERILVRDALAASTPRALLLDGRKDGQVLVHRRCVGDGWRVTRFDSAGEPVGHLECSTFERAIRNAHDLDADLSTARDVHASDEIVIVLTDRLACDGCVKVIP
jgi:hypothetical protein